MSPDEPASFAEASRLVELFGATPKTKIVAVMVNEDRHDLNVTQIGDQANISRSTVYDHLDDLVELGVIERSRTVGGSPMYQLSRDSELAKDLKRLTRTLRRAGRTEPRSPSADV